MTDIPAAERSPSLAFDLSIFGFVSLLVAAVVHVGVPAIASERVQPLVAWMLLSVPGVFLPALVGGFLVLRSEGAAASRQRLWLRSLTMQDLPWFMGGVLAMGAMSGPLFLLVPMLGLDPNPPFSRHVVPLGPGDGWMVAVWAVYWPINLLAEEMVWRGVVLPRMEARVGTWAWLLNGAAWGVVHLGFGPGNLIVLLPTLIVVPLVAQRRRSVWLAVALHAALSGPGFVALALGLV